MFGSDLVLGSLMEIKIAFGRMGTMGCLFDSEKTAMMQDGMQGQTFDSPGWDSCRKQKKVGDKEE